MSVKKFRGDTLVWFSDFYEKDGNQFDGGQDLHLFFIFCVFSAVLV